MDKSTFLSKVIEKCSVKKIDENSIPINSLITYNKWIRPTDGVIEFYHIDNYSIHLILNIINPIMGVDCGNNPPLSVNCVSFCYGNDCTITDMPDYITNIAIQELPIKSVNINIATVTLVVGAGIVLWYIGKTFEYKLESSAARRAGVKYIATD